MRLIFYNGKICTMNENVPFVEAVLIEDEKIDKIGSSEEILTEKTADTTCIDLQQRVVIPGLIDSHLHLYGTGLFLSLVQLMDATSIETVKQRVQQYIFDEQVPKGTWVRGRGWNQDYFIEGRFLTKADLDEISTDHPIVLYRVCGHIIVVNSKALEMTGITPDTMPIAGGEFDYMTGIFREKAVDLIIQHIPEPTLEEVKTTLIRAMKEANRYGLTSLHTDDFEQLPSQDFQKIIQAYQVLKSEGKLTCRIYQQSLLANLERLKTFIDQGYKTGVGDLYYKIGPLKLLADGSLGARTAALKDDYADDPGNRGILTYSDKELREIMAFAAEHGMQIAVHCIGNQAHEQVMDILATLPAHRHGIVHCQILDQAIIERFQSLGIIAYVQPIFLHYDLHIVKQRVGERLANTSYCFKTLIDLGVPVTLGTDSPIESLNPFTNIYCAVTRKDLHGQPACGFNITEALTVDEALKHYTVMGAYASFEEHIKGQLIPGMLADLVVLDQDIFTITPEKIKDIRVLLTVVGGKIVYSA